MNNIKEEIENILKYEIFKSTPNYTKDDIKDLLIKDNSYKIYKYLIENYSIEKILEYINELFALTSLKINTRKYIELIENIDELNEYCINFFKSKKDAIDENNNLNLDIIPDNEFVFNIIYAHALKEKIIKVEDKDLKEIETIKQIKEGNTELFEIWLKDNKKLIYSCVKKYVNQNNEIEDLFQEGTIAVLKAIKTFDISRNCKFSTYALWIIRQAVIRYVENNGRTIRIPVHMLYFIEKVKTTKKELEGKYGIKPTVEDIAYELNTSPKKIIQALESDKDLISLESKISKDEDREFSNFIPSKTYTDDEAIENIKKEEVYNFVNNSRLSKREKEIIFLRYGLIDGGKRTLQEVGKIFGLTRERIRQIEKKSLKRLRMARNRYKVMDLMDIDPNLKNNNSNETNKKKKEEMSSDSMAFYDPNKRYVNSAYRKNGPVITYFAKKEDDSKSTNENIKEKPITTEKVEVKEKEMTQEKKNSRSKIIKLDNLYTYFFVKYNADEALVDKMLEWLKKYPRDIEVLKLKYGNDLKNPENNELSKKDYEHFYGNILQRMKRFIKKELNIPTPTTTKKKENPIEQTLEKSISSQEFLNNIIKIITNNNLENLLKKYSLPEITIISLKYGDKFGLEKVDYSIKDISIMLNLDYEFVKNTCHKFLEDVKKSICDLVAKELDDVIILRKKKDE